MAEIIKFKQKTANFTKADYYELRLIARFDDFPDMEIAAIQGLNKSFDDAMQLMDLIVREITND